MIFTRTPVRLSLLGGGTDFPHWFKNHGGLVVGGSINKYSYISARYLPPYHDFKSRFVYSDIEKVHSHEQVEHKAIKACLQTLNMHDNEVYPPGVEVTHMADLPSRSGTGSSSAFIVGLLHALSALRREYRTARNLAEMAIDVEQRIMNECVGCQDQYFAAFGGFNFIRFHKDGEVGVYPIAIPAKQLAELESRLMLCFTGISRTSSDVAKTYVPNLTNKIREQQAMLRLAEDGLESIYKGDWNRLGALLDNAWHIKRGLGAGVSTPLIDHLYATARVHGAIGGKITGAGGGGCMVLLLKESSARFGVEQALRDCINIDFKFENDGSKVIFSD